MENNKTGVMLTEQEVRQSTENKKRRTLTTAQLPAYKTARSLMTLTLQVMRSVPRKYACFCDRLVGDIAEMMKSVAMAQESRGEERCFYIGNALGLSVCVKSYFADLHVIGVVGKDVRNKAQKLCESESSQLAGWRDFTLREGHGGNLVMRKEGTAL